MLAETGGLALAGAGLAITTIVVLIYAVAICVCCQQRPKCEAVKIDQLISVRAENTLDVPPVQNQDLTTSVVNAEPDSGRYSNGDAPSSPTASPENNVMNTSSTSSEIRHENKTSRRLPEPPPLVTREDSAASSEGATADVNRDVQGVDNESELYASVSDDVAVQVSLDARGRPEPPYAKVKKPNAAAEPEPPYSKVTPPFTAVQGAIQGSGEDSAGYTIVREPAPDYSTAEPEDVYESVQDAEAPPPVPAKNFSPDEMECDASPGAVGGYPPGIAPASVTAVQSTSRADSKESSYFSIGIREPLENLKAREQTRQLERERQQNVVTTSGASTDEEHYYTTVHSDYGDSDMYAQVGPRVTVEARDGTTHESGCNSPASELYAEIDARSGGQGSNRSSLYAKVNYGSAGNSRHDPPPEPPAVERLYNITYGMASAPTVPSTPPPRALSRPASEHVPTSPTLSTSVTDLYAVVDRSRKKTNKRRSPPGVDSPDGGRSRHSVPDGAGGRTASRRAERGDEDPAYERIVDALTTVVALPDANAPEGGPGDSDAAPDARCRGDKTGSLTRHVSGALYCSSASITFIDDIDDADDDSDDDGGEPNYSTVEETVAAATGPLVVTHSRQSSLNYEESWQQLEQQSSGAAGETANPHGLVHISRHRPTANLWMRPEHIYQELDPELVRRRKDSAQKKARRKQEEEEKRMMLQELEEEGEKKRRSHWEVEEEERRRSHRDMEEGEKRRSHWEVEEEEKRRSHRDMEEGEKRRSHWEVEEEERRRSHHRELEKKDKRSSHREMEEGEKRRSHRELEEEERRKSHRELEEEDKRMRRKREEEEEEKSMLWARERKEEEMQWTDSVQRKARRKREEEEKDAEEEKSRTRQGWESKEQEMQWLDSMQRKARREREEEEVKQRKMQRKRESQEEEEQQRKVQRERGSHEDENQHQRHSAQVSPHREWEKGEDERRQKEMRERRSNPGSGVEGYDDMEEELSTRF